MSRANDIARFVISYMNARGHVAWRNNTGGVFDPTAQRFRKGPASARGGGDVISCIKTGRYVEIEIKVGKDQQSEAQKDREARVRKAGGEYYIVHSQLEFLNLAIRKGWDK